MRKLIAKKWTRDGRVTIELNNYTGTDAEPLGLRYLRGQRGRG